MARLRASLALALAFALGGCGAVIGTLVDRLNAYATYPFREWFFNGVYESANDWPGKWRPLPIHHDMGEVTLGVAISGGGSRSAYFAACVLDELGRHEIPGTKRTFLDEVDYLSAVSGGSLAAAYYRANRRRRGYPADRAAFFERMRDDMSKDFELRTAGRFLAGWWTLIELTHFDDWNLFATTWDANFLDEMTFGDLDPRGPILIVNATCYENGQKFVFSTAPLAAKELPRLTEIVGDPRSGTWTGEARLGATMSFETLDQTIAPCPLTTAVAASSAVPGVLGPVILRDPRNGRDVSLGDGGIYDNHGLESLLQAMLPEVAAHPERPALVVVIDGAGFFDSRAAPTRLAATTAQYMDRVTAISWLRSAGFEELAYAFARREAIRLGPGHPLRDVVTETISLYDDIGLTRTIPDAPARDAIMKELRGVGTRFSLSDAARRAIARAAPALTEAALERLRSSMRERAEILREVDGPPPERVQ